MIGVSLLALGSVSYTAARADEGKKIRVTITNLTRGQIISPAVVVTHSSRMAPLFVPGEPASDAIAAVAEDAVNGPLVALLSGSPNVADVQTLFGAGGPVMPGESASVTLDAPGRHRHVSLVAMLVTTNDAFVGLNGVRAHRSKSTHRLLAYDAGSEDNNELCAFIPGPPCGNAGVRDRDGAEGYVHVHAGVHGVGDLLPTMHDWRNPVASITVERVSGDDDSDDDSDEDHDDE